MEALNEMPVKRFSHLAIRVSDVEASRRFYRDAFGFEERTQLTIKGGPTALLLGDPDVQLDAIFLERDGVVIELQKIHYPDGDTRAGFVRMGLCHFGLYVRDLDAVLAAVIEFGGDVVESSRMRNADYGSDLVFVSDPDGTFIELIDVPGDSTGPPGEPIG